MTNELFESLLYEEEGATIDFKKEQYRFAKASDEEKAEFLKDIVGFANAWRRTIDQNKDRFRIEIDCKDLQPGRRIWSDKFYIGATKTACRPGGTASCHT